MRYPFIYDVFPVAKSYHFHKSGLSFQIIVQGIIKRHES